MTTLILYVLLWVWDHRSFDSITQANERKVLAEQAYREKNYREAARLYDQIANGSIFSEPEARLNLAHAYFENKNLIKARKEYALLTGVENATIASVANTQLALVNIAYHDTAAALNHLRAALKLEPANDIARADYIILKSRFSGEELPKQTGTPKKQERQTEALQAPTPPETARQEELVQESQRKEQLLNSLKAMNMTEEQARTILDAMKSNESQFIYQLRRKQYSGKNPAPKQIEW